MRRFSVLTAIVICILATQSYAITSFYTLDRSAIPSPTRLVKFNSSPGNSDVDVIATVPGLPSQDSRAAVMDFSDNGRLFVVPHDATTVEWTIYELDPVTGDVLETFNTGLNAIEGLAVGSDGMIYASQEGGPGGRFWTIDFDQQQKTQFLNGSFEIDDIDFDNTGNLIGTDLNQSGKIYRIPLDGSQPEIIATLPIMHVASMTFSEQDNAFYFSTLELNPGGRELWRLPWTNGQPAGSLEFVKTIGPGSYIGLAAIPEPSTILLLMTAGIYALRRRQVDDI